MTKIFPFPKILLFSLGIFLCAMKSSCSSKTQVANTELKSMSGNGNLKEYSMLEDTILTIPFLCNPSKFMSKNPALIASSHIAHTTIPNCVLTIVPNHNMTGTAEIDITSALGSMFITKTITVNVLPFNDAPTLNLAESENISVKKNSPSINLNFHCTDVDSVLTPISSAYGASVVAFKENIIDPKILASKIPKHMGMYITNIEFPSDLIVVTANFSQSGSTCPSVVIKLEFLPDSVGTKTLNFFISDGNSFSEPVSVTINVTE